MEFPDYVFVSILGDLDDDDGDSNGAPLAIHLPSYRTW